MKNLFSKIKIFITTHKTVSIILLLVVLLGGYWGYGKLTSTTGETRYVTAKVETGTIISTVTGSGQVSATNQVDIKPKVSGQIVYLPIVNGQKVSRGTLIAQIDITDANKAIRDAQASLESTQIALEKLKIQDSTDNLNSSTAKAYDDGFNDVSNTFLDLPSIMTGLENMFFKAAPEISQQWYISWYEGKVSQQDHDKAVQYEQILSDSYKKALDAYNDNFDYFKSASRNSDPTTIETLISKTYDTTKLIADAIKNGNNYIDFVNNSMQNNNFNIPAIIATHRASLNNFTSQANSHLQDLLTATTNIKNDKDATPNANLDLQSSELSVTLKQNALQDAKDALTDYYVRAPFDGTIATVSVNKSDNVSSGTSVATLITKQQLAEITLNEVDVAKIKIGQKATLSFDAIPDLSIAGVVAEIDSVGTVSQGVVNYTVKISFGTQDDRVKPGMSVSASIITNMKQNVLLVANSAVKTQGGSTYVETFDKALATPATGVQGSPSLTLPNETTVVTGLSNDTQTEIVSGLKEGDVVVTKTITGTVATTTTAPSILSSVSGNRAGAAGAGATRALGR